MPYQYAIVEPDPSTMTRRDRQLGTWPEGAKDNEQVLAFYRRNHPEARLVRRMVGEWEEVE